MGRTSTSYDATQQERTQSGNSQGYIGVPEGERPELGVLLLSQERPKKKVTVEYFCDIMYNKVSSLIDPDGYISSPLSET